MHTMFLSHAIIFRLQSYHSYGYAMHSYAIFISNVNMLTLEHWSQYTSSRMLLGHDAILIGHVGRTGSTSDSSWNHWVLHYTQPKVLC